MIKKQLIPVIVILLVFCTAGGAQIRNAEFEVHNRGMLWETMKDNGTIGAPDPLDQFAFYPSMDWPGGPDELLLKDEQRSYMAGAGLWMGGMLNGSVFFTENGPFQLVDDGTFEGIEKIENYLENPGYNPNEAEERIIARFVTSENIRVERTSRVWSFPGINNFVIIEYVFTNQNSSAVNDFYVGFPYLIRPSYQDLLAHNGWGDDANRADEIVGYDTTRALLYAYDDTPNFSLPGDVGNYVPDYDELRTTGYAGYSVLYADVASDGSSQPSSALYVHLLDNRLRLTLNSNSPEYMYGLINGTDASLQAAPGDQIVPFMLQSCGPYNLIPNSPLRIVVVEAVAGLPIEDAVKGLIEQVNLPEGLGMLQSSIDAAKTLFDNGYQIAEIPPLPPVIDVIPIPTSQSIAISFAPIDTDYLDPVSGSNDFREYRIYRSDRSFNGPWERIRVLRPSSQSHVNDFFDEDQGIWFYNDTDVQLGVSYYYTVTSRDESGVESFMTNRITEPVKSANQPAENTLNISVFPNPFRDDSGLKLKSEANTITWTNLPALCTIRIYTSAGELVRTIEHDNPAIGEATWDQLNNARQKVAPGIYFWTVSSDVGSAKGTLVLIK